MNGTCGLMFIVHGTWRYLDLHLWFTCGALGLLGSLVDALGSLVALGDALVTYM